MARGASKKQAVSNGASLRVLRWGFALSTAVHLLGLWRSPPSRTPAQLLLYLATAGTALLLWLQLIRMARDGHDLALPGLTSYMFDIIYLTWATHTLAPLTTKAWFLLLLIPAYAAYWAYNKILLPFVFRGTSPFTTIANLVRGNSSPPPTAAQQQDSPALSKRQAKLQARADRGDPRVQVKRR